MNVFNNIMVLVPPFQSSQYSRRDFHWAESKDTGNSEISFAVATSPYMLHGSVAPSGLMLPMLFVKQARRFFRRTLVRMTLIHLDIGRRRTHEIARCSRTLHSAATSES